MSITLCACLLMSWSNLVHGQAGANDPTFNPDDSGFGQGDGANDAIHDLAIQPDGKVILVGAFASFNSVGMRRVARVNVNGTLDGGFSLPANGANNTVYAVALQPDGKPIIVGDLTTYQGVARDRIARLNTDGTLDITFDPMAGADGSIRAVAVQPDGKIVIGGDFMQFNGVACGRLMRLNADGSVDAGFNTGAGANNLVKHIAIRADGRILIGGTFTTVQGSARNRIAQLNSDGSLDAGFDPGAGLDNEVNVILEQPDGAILVGGDFNNASGSPRKKVARYTTTGALDPSFNPGTGANGDVRDLALRPDGTIMTAGDFTSWNGEQRSLLVRLNADGTLDGTFATSGTSSYACNANVLRDGDVSIIAGDFPTFGGTPTGGICQVDADGSEDAAYNAVTGANGSVIKMLTQPDGKTLVFGTFNNYNGTPHGYMVRLLPDGTEDLSFIATPGADWNIYDAVLQPDGRIIIAGRFNSVHGVSRNRIARLNADGTLDPSFDPGTGFGLGDSFDYYGYVYALALEADGSILVGGTFESYNEAPCYYAARLAPDGTMQPFPHALGGGIHDLVIQPDGKIIGANNGVRRINSDGSLDTTFTYTGLGAWSLSLAADGDILVGGIGNFVRLDPDGTPDPDFSPGAGVQGGGITVWHVRVLPDEKLLIGGNFATYDGVPRQGLARLHADGSLDTSFDPGTGAGGAVWCSAETQEGKLLIGGDFTWYDGTGRNRIARVFNDLSTGAGAERPVPTVVYPNPSSGLFTVTTGLEGPVEMIVQDALGKTVMRWKLATSTLRAHELDLTKHPSGIYTVVVNGGEKTSLARLVKW